MAAGIVEIGNKDLFENDIEFRGKYADYAEFLKDKSKPSDKATSLEKEEYDEYGKRLFKTNRECYIASIIVGYVQNIKKEDEDIDTKNNTKIFSSELRKKKIDLLFIYRMIILNEDFPGATIEDYKQRAFKTDDPVLRKENMAIINAYACGGLEYLYNKFLNCENTSQLTLAVYDMIQDFYDSLEKKDDYSLPSELDVSY